VWQPFYKMKNNLDEKYMRLALKQAQMAFKQEEVPVGALVVLNNKVISKAHNQREHKQSAIAHAEVIAIEKACKRLGTWRLEGCTLYVTLEPCTMCVGASILARVDRIVFGAYDPKGGMLGSLMHIHQLKGLNHYPDVLAGVLAQESSELLKAFFKLKKKPVSTAL
jgi:tRNA(adenine34) deaminase